MMMSRDTQIEDVTTNMASATKTGPMVNSQPIKYKNLETDPYNSTQAVDQAEMSPAKMMTRLNSNNMLPRVGISFTSSDQYRKEVPRLEELSDSSDGQERGVNVDIVDYTDEEDFFKLRDEQ